MSEGYHSMLRLIVNVVVAVIFLDVVQKCGSLATQAAVPVGIRAYRRFHANDSFIGKPIPCTKEEKFCFRYNALFAPEHKACLPITYHPCEWVGDRNEYFNGSGHLFAVCPEYEDLCVGRGYRMAYDGLCYPKEMVRDIICGCDAEPTPHFLGGVECRCTPPAPIHVEQPEEEGKCLIPDLRFPDNREAFKTLNDYYETEDKKFKCSAKQARCLSMRKVWVEEGEGCFPLKERGPCPEEHLVALDGQAALQGRAEGTCVHERGGCPRGQRRMAFDGQCYLDADLDLIRSGGIFVTEYGEHILTGMLNTTIGISLRLADEITDNSSEFDCYIRRTAFNADTFIQSHPPCGDSDKKRCPRMEVQNEIPQPKPEESDRK